MPPRAFPQPGQPLCQDPTPDQDGQGHRGVLTQGDGSEKPRKDQQPDGGDGPPESAPGQATDAQSREESQQKVSDLLKMISGPRAEQPQGRVEKSVDRRVEGTAHLFAGGQLQALLRLFLVPGGQDHRFLPGIGRSQGKGKRCRRLGRLLAVGPHQPLHELVGIALLAGFLVAVGIGGLKHRPLNIAVVELASMAGDQHAAHQPLAAEVDGCVPAVPVGALSVEVIVVEAMPGNVQDHTGTAQGGEPGQKVIGEPMAKDGPQHIFQRVGNLRGCSGLAL